MDDERWIELMNNSDATPTDQEIADGWHFCWEWDGLLIGPGMMEMGSCACGVNMEVHKRVPPLEETGDF